MAHLVSAWVTAFLLVPLFVFASGPGELGEVNWMRNMDAAREQANVTHKPILILFQEVPGCMTCKRYGSEVLSHPLIVETIESYFIPLAIYNNKGGSDQAVLNYFKEPSWNNPVVRVVNADMEDIKPRLNGRYSASDLVEYMKGVMRELKIEVPHYLDLLDDELKARSNGLKKATLSMFCFWTGEMELGKLPGVVKTEAGFMDHHEVVNVYYDPREISLKEIIKEGTATDCTDAAYLTDIQQKKEARSVLDQSQVKDEKQFKSDRQPKYYLSRTVYRYVPMSPIQAVKVNAMIGQGLNPDPFLSPRQRAIAHFANEYSVDWPSSIHADDWKQQFFQRWAVVSDKT